MFNCIDQLHTPTFLTGLVKTDPFWMSKTDCWKYPLTMWQLSLFGFLVLIWSCKRYRKMCSLVGLSNVLLCVKYVIPAILNHSSSFKAIFLTFIPSKTSFKNFYPPECKGWRRLNDGRFVSFYLSIFTVSHSKPSWPMNKRKTCLKFFKIQFWWQCHIQSYFEADIPIWGLKRRPQNSQKCKN